MFGSDLGDYFRYKKFARELYKARRELVDIIREINRSNDEAVQKLDASVFNELNKELFLLNAKALREEARYNFLPFFIHPASSAWLFAKLAENDEALKTAIIQTKEIIIGYILTHDTLEKAFKQDTAMFVKTKTEWPAIHHNALDASALLTAPGKTLLQRVSILYQVKQFGTREHAYALLATKLDNMLDLDYLDGQDRPREEKRSVIRWWIAYSLFAAELLEDKTPEMKPYVNMLCNGMMERHWLTKKSVEEKVSQYRRCLEQYQSQIDKEAKERLAKFK